MTLNIINEIMKHDYIKEMFMSKCHIRGNSANGI